MVYALLVRIRISGVSACFVMPEHCVSFSSTWAGCAVTKAYRSWRHRT